MVDHRLWVFSSQWKSFSPSGGCEHGCILSWPRWLNLFNILFQFFYVWMAFPIREGIFQAFPFKLYGSSRMMRWLISNSFEKPFFINGEATERVEFLNRHFVNWQEIFQLKQRDALILIFIHYTQTCDIYIYLCVCVWNPCYLSYIWLFSPGNLLLKLAYYIIKIDIYQIY